MSEFRLEDFFVLWYLTCSFFAKPTEYPMPDFFSFGIWLVGKTKEDIKSLVDGLKDLGITEMGFGHNNSRTWVVWTDKDISEFIKQKGFKFSKNLLYR